jgi:hypothetical protein
MLNLHLDLTNSASLLHLLADDATKQRLVNAAAESFTDDILEWIRAGRAFRSRTAHLEQSIDWQGLGNGTAEVYTNAEYARYVEEGTGKPAGHSAYDVFPKNRKALKILNGGVSSPLGPMLAGGGYILRRKAHHEGNRPYPFFNVDGFNREQNLSARATLVLAHIANGTI